MLSLGHRSGTARHYFAPSNSQQNGFADATQEVFH